MTPCGNGLITCVCIHAGADDQLTRRCLDRALDIFEAMKRSVQRSHLVLLKPHQRLKQHSTLILVGCICTRLWNSSRQHHLGPVAADSLVVFQMALKDAAFCVHCWTMICWTLPTQPGSKPSTSSFALTDPVLTGNRFGYQIQVPDSNTRFSQSHASRQRVCCHHPVCQIHARRSMLSLPASMVTISGSTQTF